MKRVNWQVRFGVFLVALSAAIYGVHYLLFHDAHHIAIYMVGDLAFVPVEVLIVTLILHQLLTAREKRAMLSKLNMVIGSFFSEVGTPLLRLFTSVDPTVESLRDELAVTGEWSADDFKGATEHLGRRAYTVEPEPQDFTRLRDFLNGRRGFLLGLLANPNLLEHESFTDLLWAIFHLTEELVRRDTLVGLPTSDYDHLAGDSARAYGRLAQEWLSYMRHLETDYPYLFSLAVRTNPFDIAATPIVA